MNFKKAFSFFGLILGLVILFAFSSPPDDYSCRLEVDNIGTGYVGVGGYGVHMWIASGGSDTESSCLCPNNPGPTTPYIQVYGSSSSEIDYTVYNSNNSVVASGTVGDGVYSY